MYFNSHMFNSQHVNPPHVNPYQYQMIKEQDNYNRQQDKKVYDAVKAMHDFFKAVNGMDEQHKKLAFSACLAEIGKFFGR